MANVEVKAHRLARDGSVQPIVAPFGIFRATVRGESGTYAVEITPNGSTCECVASHFKARCSHIRAVYLFHTDPY